MKQGKLFTPRADRSVSLKREADRYDAANLKLAQEFLDHPELHGGADSFGVLVWAPEVLRRLRKDHKGDAGQ